MHSCAIGTLNENLHNVIFWPCERCFEEYILRGCKWFLILSSHIEQKQNEANTEQV